MPARRFSRARTCLAGLALGLAVTPVVAAVGTGTASAAPYGQLIVNNAATHLGQTYVYGATGPTTFDCSGFTGFVYRQFGVTLPRTSADQYNAVAHVPQDQKEVGDLIFMYDAGGIYHVGIYAGNNVLWAATHTGDVVRPEAIWTSSYLVGRPQLGGAIGAKWQALGGARSALGQAVDLEHDAPGARVVDYQGGQIAWTPATGANAVQGAIAGLYGAMGGTGSVLGVPLNDEHAVPGGRGNDFTGGTIAWSPGTGQHEVHGAIGLLYRAMGGASGVLGLPVSDETAVPGGRANRFTGGTVAWSPATGQHEVHGAIALRYTALGGPAGALGLPVTDEQPAPGGRQSVFERGVLRWDATTGAVTQLPR